MIAAERSRAATAFLDQAGWAGAERRPLAGDASNRRYERIRRGAGAGADRAVLMDAPPEKGEDVRPFAALTEWLRAEGFSAPAIFAADAEQGFLLLEDLGDDLFARVAEARPASEAALYEAAVDQLAQMQRSAPPATARGWGASYAVPPYDLAALRSEALLAVHWWSPGASDLAAPDPALQVDLRAAFIEAFDAACAPVAEARSVLSLRDFHAENLIWLPERSGAARVGLLDYQDALAGHPAYDLVSLLEDARRDVSPELADAMISRFETAAAMADGEAFRAAYAALGAQRNLKIVGIFARLWLRDGKDRYLAHIPRVWRYLRRDLEHPALASLKALVEARIPEPTPARLGRLKDRRPGAFPAPEAVLAAAAPVRPVRTAGGLA
ncbi:MAG: phosphotransferase [Pseudomonadota bacterium]